MESGADILEVVDPSGIPLALAVLVASLVVARLVTRTAARLGGRFSNKRLVIQQIGSFARFLVFFLGAVWATLLVVHQRPGVWLAIGGTIAVSIGFALKDLVASIVAGLIILVDRPFQVGDRVSFDGYYGEVIHIGLRSVRLMTLDDTQVTIPNNKFLTDSVASGNAGAVDMMIQMDFHISADQDLGRAKQVVTEALTSSRYVSSGRHWSVNVSEVVIGGMVALRLRAKAYVLDVRFEKAFETDVTERVVEGLREAGIARPAIVHRQL